MLNNKLINKAIESVQKEYGITLSVVDNNFKSSDDRFKIIIVTNSMAHNMLIIEIYFLGQYISEAEFIGTEYCGIKCKFYNSYDFSKIRSLSAEELDEKFKEAKKENNSLQIDEFTWKLFSFLNNKG